LERIKGEKGRHRRRWLWRAAEEESREDRGEGREGSCDCGGDISSYDERLRETGEERVQESQERLDRREYMREGMDGIE